MSNISDIFKQYSKKLDHLDLELLIAHILKKPREFVIAHPEHELNKYQVSSIKYNVSARIKGKPLAYILGEKEFYGLKFKVNKDVLIPRPETEMLVDLALKNIQNTKYQIPNTIIDVGTGSSNIIIAIAKKMGFLKFYGIDISEKALRVAKQNAKLNKVDKKIKFIKSDLLNYFFKNIKYIIPDTKYIILANLPYLSQKIYNSTMPDVKNFEPKSALLSGKDGLDHYRKLFKQIKLLKTKNYKLQTVLLEISPEQKPLLQKIIKKEFSKSKTTFYKDLARKWRVCEISL